MDDETLEDASDEAAAASIVSPSETIELAVLFIVSKDCEDRRADLRRRLYGLKRMEAKDVLKDSFYLIWTKKLRKGFPTKKAKFYAFSLNCEKLVKGRPDR